MAYETEETLPVGLIGGWFKLEDGVIVEYPELKPKSENEEIATRMSLLEDAFNDFLLGGAL